MFTLSKQSQVGRMFFDDLKITHSEGPVVATNTYYPFGAPIARLSFQRATTPVNRFKFINREYVGDYGLELYDHLARWYDPWWGSGYTTVDPLSEIMPDWTPYRYGFNNPIRYTDPTGLAEQDSYGRDTHDRNGMYIRPGNRGTKNRPSVASVQTSSKNNVDNNNGGTIEGAGSVNLSERGVTEDQNGVIDLSQPLTQELLEQIFEGLYNGMGKKMGDVFDFSKSRLSDYQFWIRKFKFGYGEAQVDIKVTLVKASKNPNEQLFIKRKGAYNINGPTDSTFPLVRKSRNEWAAYPYGYKFKNIHGKTVAEFWFHKDSKNYFKRFFKYVNSGKWLDY